MDYDVVLFDRFSRDKAREGLRLGKLSSRPPTSASGGWGDGSACAVCEAPVSSDQARLAIEIKADDGAGHSYRMARAVLHGLGDRVRLDRDSVGRRAESRGEGRRLAVGV